MSFGEWLASSRLALERDLAGSELQWKFSPSLYLLRTELVPLLRQHVRGRVLDVGCGRMPFKRYLEGQIELYHGFDIERRSPDTKYLGNAQDMVDVPDSSYDTVVSFSVLEHLPRPWEALAEMRRVCRPGGTVIVEVPHLSRYHELPHDYYRFTAQGLSILAADAGLDAVRIEAQGGVLAFLGHQVSSLVVCGTWRIPILRHLVFWLNYLLVVRLPLLLDRIAHTRNVLPMGLVGIFRCPETDEKRGE